MIDSQTLENCITNLAIANSRIHDTIIKELLLEVTYTLKQEFLTVKNIEQQQQQKTQQQNVEIKKLLDDNVQLFNENAKLIESNAKLKTIINDHIPQVNKKINEIMEKYYHIQKLLQ